MNLILVDSSIWIDYFRGGTKVNSSFFEKIIDTNQICINDLILSELIPSLKIQKNTELIDILLSIKNIPLFINWDEIIEYQYINIKNGINKVGIPDLIIIQNVIHNSLSLFTLDKHFKLMQDLFKFEVI